MTPVTEPFGLSPAFDSCRSVWPVAPKQARKEWS